MYLTKHQSADGPRWALDGRLLPPQVGLDRLMQVPQAALADFLRALPRGAAPTGGLLAPIEPMTEVWAAGVTYLRSREAREAESSVKDVYTRVYEAERPELFWKAIGWRVVGHQMPIRIRDDSRWNVPEPELTLVINARREIVGYCAGNDVSSRDIEGENPLYLPQAKVYDGACALGPGIVLCEADRLRDLPICISVARGGAEVFQGETRTAQMARPFEELVAFLGRELALPHGAFLMTGTGIVPPPDFSMRKGDVVRITVGELALENVVDPGPRAQDPDEEA
jgi:2-dehydro-3-deoxy-D-arabinonate dehydratase